MTNDTILGAIVSESGAELLDGKRFPARRCEGGEPAMECAAVIGFYAPELRGVLGLGMGAATLSALAGRSTEMCPEDWLAETLNQLLGRIKNELVAYGIEAGLALPTVLRGMRLAVSSRRPTGLWAYAVDTDVGSICVWIDARWQEGFVLTRTSDPEMQSATGGDLVLF